MKEGGTELEAEVEEGELEGPVRRTCEDMELEEDDTELEEGDGWWRRASWRGQRRRAVWSWRLLLLADSEHIPLLSQQYTPVCKYTTCTMYVIADSAWYMYYAYQGFIRNTRSNIQ